MSKYHINAKGVPAVCRAVKGNCPYGGVSGDEGHYDSLEKAQEAIDKRSEAKHSILPGIKGEYEEKQVEETEVMMPKVDSEKEVIEENSRDSEKTNWYIYSDGSHSSEKKEGKEIVHMSQSWDEAMVRIGEVDETRYSEIHGIEPSISVDVMSVEDQEEHYLSKDDIEPGVKRGPYRAFNNKDDIKRFSMGYLGRDTENLTNYDLAEKHASLNGGETLILGEKERAGGVFGLLGGKRPKKGIVLRKVHIRGEDDVDKKQFQLSEVFEIEYLNESGIKRRKREFKKQPRGTTSLKGPRIFKHEDEK